MKKLLRPINTLLKVFGFNPIKTVNALRGLPLYLNDLKKLKVSKTGSRDRDLFPFGEALPCFGDRISQSGEANGHYFHQDLLVARRIYLNKPHIHVDVGSRVDGFVAHVASFRPIKVIDIRPQSSSIPNIEFIQADLMGVVKGDKLVNICDSLSCLHALEHFGLGRYGDPVNYDGHLAGLNNLHLILRKDGKLYFSVPIGPQRIVFNAHRVFSVSYLLRCFANKYNIDQFSYVDDNGDLHENIPLNEANIKNNFGCSYGCGIFEMTKL